MRSLISLLGVRDWVYSLSLVVPLGLYNAVLKFQEISQLGETSWWDRFQFVRSNLFFSLGFGLCWIALFALARRGPQRWAVLVLLHVAALSYAVIVVAGRQYFAVTGASLDYDLIALAFTEFTELRPVLASEVSLGEFAIVIAYCLLGPVLVVLVADRVRLLPKEPRAATPRLAWALLPVAMAVAILALLPVVSPLGISFSRDPMLHVLVTAAERVGGAEPVDGVAGAPGPVNATLVARPDREPKNLVLIILESTGASSVTAYNESLATTPYLDELAKTSLVVERAYSTIPHTSKALVSIVCGIEPRPIRAISEALPGLVPSTCLPDLLDPHGYRSVFFQSASESFQDRRQLVENFGYQDFFPGESMRTRGFERANYFGFEDDVMLAPSRRWLEANGDEPFFATYLTVTPHHQYLAPSRYGRVEFTERQNYNLYLNAVRYQDFFLNNLISQYRELGLYQNTIFFVLGDHGEAFGEHRRSKHDDVLYEEVVRVPFLVHDPAHLREPEHIEGPASILDVLPSAADLLGFEITQGEYPGSSILSLPAERALFFSCLHENRCLGWLEDGKKFIYHYGNQPDEVFDLSTDPEESTNLAADTSVDLQTRRAELRDWRERIDDTYRRHQRDQIGLSVFDARPAVDNSLDVFFHDSLSLIGYDLSQQEVRRGESFRITYYFHVLDRLPPTWRLVLQARPGEEGEAVEIPAASPLQRLYRLRFWKPGQYIADEHTITVPEDWPSSSFAIALGFFNRRREQMVRVRPRPSIEDELAIVTRLPVQ